MKKKHRDITVDSIKYGWIVEPHAAIKSMTVLKVYKDKKVWFTVTSLGTVLPSDVKKFIDIKLKAPTDTTAFAVKVKAPKAKAKSTKTPIKLDMFKKATKDVKVTSEWKVCKP